MSSQTKKLKEGNPLLIPVVLDSVFKHLSPCDLCRCRLVHQIWNSVAFQALKRSLKTRLLLSADQKCAKSLGKILKCFTTPEALPYTRAILVVDHLPTQLDMETPSFESLDSEKFFLAMAALDQAFETPNSFNSWNYSNTLHSATLEFSTLIENLIVTLSLHQEDSTNMENWLCQLQFPNLKELHFHVTKTCPDDMSIEPFQRFLSSAPQLETLGIRKLFKNSDNIFCKILQALEAKNNLCRLKKLFLEVFTDDKKHLEILTNLPLSLEYLSLLYLGGEVRFVDKLEGIKNFIESLSSTLKYLCTHIPLFSGGQMHFPKLPFLQTLKVEKVYREFAPNQSTFFDFEFSKFFPNLRNIQFRDYDIWKTTQLNAFPMKDMQACWVVQELSLPDIYFDELLMQKYLRTFPNIRKLSCILSYQSQHQDNCSFMQIYSLLPKLKELEVQIYDIDVSVYDNIFIGFSSRTSKSVPEIELNSDIEKEAAVAVEQRLSIALLKDLELLKITYVNDAKVIGITDLTVMFGFVHLKRLKKLTIGPSLISNKGMDSMTAKFDVIAMRQSNTNSNYGEEPEFADYNSSGTYDCRHTYL